MGTDKLIINTPGNNTETREDVDKQAVTITGDAIGFKMMNRHELGLMVGESWLEKHQRQDRSIITYKAMAKLSNEADSLHEGKNKLSITSLAVLKNVGTGTAPSITH
jgi:hypothetical protein